MSYRVRLENLGLATGRERARTPFESFACGSSGKEWVSPWFLRVWLGTIRAEK